MSYRTYINHNQIFGNNEYYPEWIDFIKSQGIEVDEEGNYDGQITDFMGALKTIEKITMRLEAEFQERKDAMNRLNNKHKPIQSLFDLSNIPAELEDEKNFEIRESLFDKLFRYVRDGYAFMPYTFYLACEDILDLSDAFETDKMHMYCFKLKDGKTINVSAS